MKILKNLDIENLVWLSIETVRSAVELPQGAISKAWEYKQRYAEDLEAGQTLSESYAKKAALYAEFGKIVAISIAKVVGGRIVTMSYLGDEAQILNEFSSTIEKLNAKNKDLKLVGFSLNGFIHPYLTKRMLINRVPIPAILDTADLKPWLQPNIDIMSLWKGTGFSNSSLCNVAVAFGLDYIETGDVSELFYNDALSSIREKSEASVATLVNITLLMRGDAVLLSERSSIQAEGAPILSKIANTGKATQKDKDKLAKAVVELPQEWKGAGNDIIKATLSTT